MRLSTRASSFIACLTPYYLGLGSGFAKLETFDATIERVDGRGMIVSANGQRFSGYWSKDSKIWINRRLSTVTQLSTQLPVTVSWTPGKLGNEIKEVSDTVSRQWLTEVRSPLQLGRLVQSQPTVLMFELADGSRFLYHLGTKTRIILSGREASTRELRLNQVYFLKVQNSGLTSSLSGISDQPAERTSKGCWTGIVTEMDAEKRVMAVGDARVVVEESAAVFRAGKQETFDAIREGDRVWMNIETRSSGLRFATKLMVFPKS